MSSPKKPKDVAEILSYGGLLHRITNRIRQSLELEEILSATVAEMRLFLQTDRVKVYRFHPDGSGQVIAESVANNRLPSLKGLNFPADDIPPSAREMFIKAQQRSIVDVAAQKILLSRSDRPLSTAHLTIEDLYRQPIEDILQRAVDPCHVDYLTGMGVQSSLVVPIFHQGNLWGLLVSHHSLPQAFSIEDLQLVQIIADQLSIAIAQSELLSQTREQVRRESIINQITTLLHSPRNIEEILQLAIERAVRAVHSSGGRLYLTCIGKNSPALYTCGIQPTLLNNREQNLLEDHPFWQKLIHHQNQPFPSTNFRNVHTVSDIYQEPQLESLIWAFQSTPIRGILVMPLQYSQQSLGYLTIFRNANDIETKWAGYWDKDERQQRPRESFQMWRELKRNQPPEWSREDTELIQSLAIHLAMGLMQNQLYQLQMNNLELSAARAVAEEASRLKSNFLASTSHELRTPLASTLNYLKLLKEGFYSNEEEFKKYINVAHQSAENLVAIVNDVLDIAKIEAGGVTLNLQTVNLTPLLEQLRDLFILESQRKGVELIVECEVDSVFADKGKLRQILTNLLSNSLKFTASGSVCIKAIAQLDRPMVEIAVTDTGIGIDIKQKEILFEPFVQEDGSIKRHYGGTGLGLAICKRLVELMGGAIHLHSAGRNQGTTVTFTLPSTEAVKVEENSQK